MFSVRQKKNEHPLVIAAVVSLLITLKRPISHSPFSKASPDTHPSLPPSFPPSDDIPSFFRWPYPSPMLHPPASLAAVQKKLSTTQFSRFYVSSLSVLLP